MDDIILDTTIYLDGITNTLGGTQLMRVRCLEEGVLLCLPKKDYLIAMRSLAHQNQLAQEQSLSKFQLLSHLTQEQIRVLLKHNWLQEKHYDFDDLVYKQGDPVDGVYFIREGVCQIDRRTTLPPTTPLSPGSDPMTIRVSSFQSHDALGYEDLHKPCRFYSARSTSENLSLYFLATQHMLTVFQPIQEVLQKEIAKLQAHRDSQLQERIQHFQKQREFTKKIEDYQGYREGGGRETMAQLSRRKGVYYYQKLIDANYTSSQEKKKLIPVNEYQVMSHSRPAPQTPTMQSVNQALLRDHKYLTSRQVNKSLFSPQTSFKHPPKQQEAKEKTFRLQEYRTYRAHEGFWKSASGQHELVQRQRLNQSYVPRQDHLTPETKMHKRYQVDSLAERSPGEKHVSHSPSSARLSTTPVLPRLQTEEKVPRGMDPIGKLLNQQRLAEKRALYSQLSQQHSARRRLLVGMSLEKQIQEIENKARASRGLVP